MRRIIALLLVLGLGVFAAAALAGNGTPGNPPGKGGDDTTSECSPSQGGDPCVHNGGGHGNCGDNQGNGSNGNDNGFGNKPGCSDSTSTTT